LDAWGVEMLRLTTFHASLPKAEGWWESVTGQEPESSVGKKTGERAEIGPWEGLMLALQVTPQGGRIDWVGCDPPGEHDSLGPLCDRLPAFTGLAQRWLTSELLPQPTSRMAFGAVVNLPVASPEEGYRRLSDYLPFDIDRTTSSDFFYQINRQRKSTTVPEVRINRLTKWNVGLFVHQTIRLSGSGVIAAPERNHERCSCRLELDINTTEGPSLPQDRLQPLFDELVALGEEIIREGDTP
jgi:hypothetical protein